MNLLLMLFLLISIEELSTAILTILSFVYISNKRIKMKYIIILLLISFLSSVFKLDKLANTTIILNLALIIAYPLKEVVYPLKEVVYPLKEVVYPLKEVVYPLKKIVYSLKGIVNNELPIKKKEIATFLVAILTIYGFYHLYNRYISSDISFESTPSWYPRGLDNYDNIFNQYLNYNCTETANKEIILSAYCPITDTVKLGSDGNLSDRYTLQTEAKTIIFNGCDTKEFCKMITEDTLRNTIKDKNIILTPIFLKSVMESSCNKELTKYLDNYKKSGDIYNSNGNEICMLNEITWIPIENKGVVFAAKGSYSDIKNYAMAYLIESNFDIKGLENPSKFLKMIAFPKPCGIDYTTFISKLEYDYKTKYEANILEMDKSGGVLIKKPMALKPNNRYLPLIKTIKLGENTYICSGV